MPLVVSFGCDAHHAKTIGAGGRGAPFPRKGKIIVVFQTQSVHLKIQLRSHPHSLMDASRKGTPTVRFRSFAVVFRALGTNGPEVLILASRRILRVARGPPSKPGLDNSGMGTAKPRGGAPKIRIRNAGTAGASPRGLHLFPHRRPCSINAPPPFFSQTASSGDKIKLVSFSISSRPCHPGTHLSSPSKLSAQIELVRVRAWSCSCASR